jgi:hypothetical protein
VSELGRLVAEHAKVVMTTDRAGDNPSGDLATAPVTSTAAPPVSGTVAATAATMVARSPAIEAACTLQQQQVAIVAKGLAAMIAKRSPAIEAMRTLQQQHVAMVAKHWASNATILPVQAGPATTATLFPVRPSAVVTRTPVLPHTDPGALGWMDLWRQMSPFERSMFVLAVVTALLTMAQVAIGAAEFLQRPQASAATEQGISTNQGSVVVPTTTARPSSKATTSGPPTVVSPRSDRHHQGLRAETPAPRVGVTIGSSHDARCG